jgi:hypothetical protein
MLKLNRCLEQHRELEHESWLEVYGETNPTLGWGADTSSIKGSSLYEYRWALGYPPPSSSHPTQGRSLVRHTTKFGRLADPAAHVYLFFAASCNWRVSEILATVKHLAPVEDERTWREELAKDFTAIQPFIGAAGHVAAAATGMPELGSIAETVSHLKLTSVPQTPNTQWFVRKVDLTEGQDVFHGIEWQLPLNLLEQLGSRVTGGLLVNFASVHAEEITPTDQSRGLLAKAVLHYVDSNGASKDIPIPTDDPATEKKYVQLALAPH